MRLSSGRAPLTRGTGGLVGTDRSMFESLGGFFAVADEASPSHVPLTAASLIQAFPARIAAVDHALPAASHLSVPARKRVIVSVAHQGWMARLVSPMLAARVSDLRGGFVWTPDATSFFSLAHKPDAVTGADTLRDFTEQVSTQFGVSEHVLTGNTASALNSAARLLQTPSAYATANDLLSELGEIEGPAGPGFRRKSCCLIYQLTDQSARSGLCGDCVLRPE